MKKCLVLSCLLMLGSVMLEAQKAHKDYFVGKWSVSIIGTPGGDSNLIMDLKRVNGKLEGQILREGKDPTEISKIEETPSTVKVYFRHNLFKVSLLLAKKDEMHCEGKLLDNFNAKSIRIR